LGIATANWFTSIEARLAKLVILAGQMGLLTLSPHKTEKPALLTVTNSCNAAILACSSLIYALKDEISA